MSSEQPSTLGTSLTVTSSTTGDSSFQQQQQNEHEQQQSQSTSPEQINLAPYFAVGPEPHDIICPLCKENVTTIMRAKFHYYNVIYSLLTCLSCCFPAFCALCLIYPFCPTSMYRHHYCPKCKGYLGRFHRP